MYGLVVRFELLAGHEQAFDELVEGTLKEIVPTEPGTLLYLSHRVPDSPGARVFYELYVDRAAFEAHEATPHVRRFLAERQAHLSVAPEVVVIDPVAGEARDGLADILQ